MIEYNGWIVIRESFNKKGEDEQLLKEIIHKVKTKISLIKITNEVFELQCLNDEYHLAIMANQNHRNEHIIDFFNWVASISVGSYGILYVQDDEDIKRGNENNFMIWRMKKGLNNKFKNDRALYTQGKATFISEILKLKEI